MALTYSMVPDPALNVAERYGLRQTLIRKRRTAALAVCPGIPDEKKPRISMHTLRHTAASLMVAAGVPIFDVSKVLGHGSVLMTMRYAHFAPEASRGAIDALDRKLRPEASTPQVSEAIMGIARRGGYARGAPGHLQRAGAERQRS
jgi:hypothetical protein